MVGTAKFGSGLLSVTFCRPSMTEIGVRVVIGECDYRAFNKYYETSLAEADMSLAKTTNVNVRVECSDLSYDSGALGVDGDLLAAYHDIANIYNDPVVWDDVYDLSTIKGDAVRYFIIPNAEPGQSYSVDISTDAVSSSVGGRLQSMTLTGRTLPREELRGAAMSCVKHSYYDNGESFKLVQSGSSWWGWDQGSGESRHTYGTPRTWTGSGFDASGNVTYSGTGDPIAGELLCVGAHSSNLSAYGYVTALDTGAKTFVLVDCEDNPIDLTSQVSFNILSCTDEPATGLSGYYAEQIVATDPHFFISLDDAVYMQRIQASGTLPILKGGQTKGMPIPIMTSEDTLENASHNRTTGTQATLALLQLARFYFIQPYTIEMLQKAPGVFIRGDWDVTPGNDFSHHCFDGINSAAWVTWGGSPSDTTNPLADTVGFANRQTQRVLQWANCTDVWNTYFGGGNPQSFFTDSTDFDYPPILEIDASGNKTVDPTSAYSANSRYYLNRGFVIENARHCLMCPDSLSHRGGRVANGDWDTHPYCSQVNLASPTHIYGGEYVFGPTQEAEIYKKINSVKSHKNIGLLNKGMLTLGTYTLDEINKDSSIASGTDEANRVTAFLSLIGSIGMSGDRHVTYTERADGKGRAVV